MQFFKRDSRSLEAAKGVSNKTFKYYEVTYHCIRGGKNFKPRGTGKKETRYLSIYLGRTLYRDGRFHLSHSRRMKLLYRDGRFHLSHSRRMKLCPRTPQ